MLCFSKVLWLRRLGKSAPKNGSCGGSAARDSDLEVKTGMLGPLFEIQVAKICTTRARESDLETVKAPGSRTTF